MISTKRMGTSMILRMLAFVGSVGVEKSDCLGWFYKPKMPKDLIQDKVNQ
ncbi:cyclic lactone autoinducer peptide [Dehalobacter sp. DCM]|nr:cyclic lactone autoinducer peptide [Dehalobacter sp. DCM]